MKALEHICMVAVTAAVVFATIEIGMLTRETRLKFDVLASESQATLVDAHRVILVAGGTVNQLRDTIRDTQKSNEALARNSARATAQLNTDLVKFGKVLDQVSSTTADIDMATEALSHQASDVLADAHGTVIQAQPAIANLTRAAAGAAEVMNDSNIHATLANVQQTSQQVVGIATDAHTESSLIVKQTQKAFEPKNKFWSIMQMVVGNTVTGAELFYYLSH